VPFRETLTIAANGAQKCARRRHYSRACFSAEGKGKKRLPEGAGLYLNEGVGEHVRTRFQTGCKDAKAWEASKPEPTEIADPRDPHRTKKSAFLLPDRLSEEIALFEICDPAVDLMSRRHPLCRQEPLFQICS
jgi:hypothetical protein